ncbi:uncharacterized protein LOC21386205 [Morus notabilis]|nr:uncharacterized protein LOC21386205 [Morus notabilis]
MMSESPCYCLPQVVLNLTSLTVLNLDGVKLQDCSHVNLPSLKSLSLRDVLVKDEVLHNLVLGCPAIQNLVIMVVNALSYIEISSSSLKHLDIDADLDEIQVDAINLESFVCFGTCNYYIASCKKLSSLSLTAAYFPLHEDLENIISGFPLLESLTLAGGSIVDVRHPNLKVLVLERSDKEDNNNISIDAPNLVSFTYSEEDTLPQILVNSPNLLETNISLKLYLEGRTMEWYVNMLNFLSSFDCSKSMSLNLHSEESVIFPETLRKITHYCPLPNLRHLKVKTRCVQRESDLENSLRWLAPFLETLSIEQSVE